MKMQSTAGKARLGLSCLALLLMSGCGGADRQKEADEITKGIESYLALMEDPSQQIRLRHDKITVTPDSADKGFTVAITGLRFGSDKVPGATFGEVDYRLTPQDADTYQVDNLKIANEIPLVGVDGKPMATMTLETTSFSGLWSTPLRNFLKYDWAAKNLAVRLAGATEDWLHADDLTAKADGKEAGKGLLDETIVLGASGISGSSPTTGGKFAIANFTGNVSAAGFDMPAYLQQMTKLRAVMRKIAANNPPAGEAAPAAPQPLSAEDSKAMAESLRALPKVVADYSYDLGISGLTETAADGSSPVHLDKAGMGFALKGINTDKAELDFNIRHDGLALSGPDYADPATKAMFPKSSSISLAATELPVPALVEAVAGAIPDLTSKDPSVAQGGKIEIMGALMSALAKSNIKLRIQPSTVDTAIAHLSADGDLALAMQSPIKAVGAVNLALVGLDDIIALANAETQQRPDAAGAIGMLQMVQSFAKRETGADGKPVDKFKIDLTAAGKITINDKPLGGM
jgi:hypothetical protein